MLLPPTTSDKEKVLHIQDASYHEVEPLIEDFSFLGHKLLFLPSSPPPPNQNATQGDALNFRGEHTLSF